MSSILRALKKLEEDSLSPDKGEIVPQKKLKQVVGRRVNRRTKAPRLLKWTVSIGMAAVLVLAGAVLWNYFTAKSGPTAGSAPLPASMPEQSSSPGQETAIAQPAATPPVQPAPPVQTPDNVNTAVNTGVHTGINIDNRQGAESPGEVVVSPDTEARAGSDTTNTAGSQALPTPRPVTPPTGARTGSTGSPLARPGLYARPGLTTQTAATPPTDEPTPPMQPMHPNLVLNGVLWSDNPERRVALINDRYLHEGDSIDGVSVVKIEKKAVTLQSGSEKWTITVQK